jgi:ubiquinone/menaquinone biosynthesis C-methylase UbiE
MTGRRDRDSDAARIEEEGSFSVRHQIALAMSAVEFDKEAAEEYDQKDHIKEFAAAVQKLLSSWEWLLSSSKRPLEILDFGCGTGVHTLGIAQHGHKVTAADVSPDMLNVLRSKLKDTPQEKQVTLVQSKEDGSGFASDHYDAVFIFFVMHHVAADQRQLVISNLTKTLKRDGGGRLVVLELEETERSKASFASFHNSEDEKKRNSHFKEKEEEGTHDNKEPVEHTHDHDHHDHDQNHHGHKHDWLDRKTVASWMKNAGLNTTTIVDQSFEIPHKHGIMDCYFVTGIR